MIIRRLYSNKQKDDITPGLLTGGALGLGAVGVAGYATPVVEEKYNNYINAGIKPNAVEDYSGLKFSVGDIVSAERKGGAYSHFGVVTSIGPDGKPIITNYTNPSSLDPRYTVVKESTLEQFGHGGRIHIEKNSGRFTPEEIQRRAQEFINNGYGQYSVSKNNCEHFARELANGKKESFQVGKVVDKVKGKVGSVFQGVYDKAATTSGQKLAEKSAEVLEKSAPVYESIMKGISGISERLQKRFSKVDVKAAKNALELLKDEAKTLVSNKKGFEIRKSLSKDLGGLSHFGKYQTAYLSSAGAAVGGMTGCASAGRRAKKDAEEYNLEKGTLEYDNFIKSRKHEGAMKGAALGAGSGALLSKGVDFTRGKVIADKARASHNLDLGKDYVGLGRNMRGVRSEEDITKVTNNWGEIGSYLNGVKKGL